ncbi:MAG TPA: molybdate ABC transporter substrate-binding protein [Gammaproteobacteria bacterium]|nr:molybdate ABC transporter substrate-binding protein [Gammaproteobacteria bacterium]
MRIFLRLLGLLMFAPAFTHADEVNVAVATNFLPALKKIVQHFERDTGHRLRISAGSTGKLFVQIKQGAPFDILLAADAERPRLLEEQGLAVKGSRFTYAIGQLVLWSPRPGFIDGAGGVLKNEKFNHLAIANPKIAPYGKAAQQALMHLGLWKQLRPRLVQGEDIGQTLQFIASGNAELGFVAFSQIVNLPDADKGGYWPVPQELYEPIQQQAVLLARAADNVAARAFFTYLNSGQARTFIRQAGYALGGSTKN